MRRIALVLLATIIFFGALIAPGIYAATGNQTQLKPQGPPVLVHLLLRLLGFFMLIAAVIIAIFIIRALIQYVHQPQAGLAPVLYPLIALIILASIGSLLMWITGGLFSGLF